MRNAHGDRVAHALEFLLSIGIDADSPEQTCTARWITEIAGLQLVGTVKAILDSPELTLDGFLGPGHVSMVIGNRPYDFIA